MSATVFKFEFKMHLRSVIIWSAAAVAVILLYASFFPSFSQEAELLNDLISRLPRELVTAFGMGGVNLATVLGYFGFIYSFLQVLLAVQAAHYGLGLVSVEEREWTADFLLTKPVTRSQIMTSKLLAVLSGLALTQIAVWAGTFACLEAFKGEQTYDVTVLVWLLLGLIPFQLVFLTVGLVISLLVGRLRNVTPYALGLAFGMYVLSAFGGMLGENILEKITPFKHFEAAYLLEHGTFDLPLVSLSVVAILISVAVSYPLYIRRDIPAVT